MSPIARSEGIRSARWKYVCFLDEEPMRETLFDLEADPYETRDLAQSPGYEPTLIALRERWRAEGGGSPRGRRPRLPRNR